MPTPYEIAQGYAGQVEGPKQTLLNKFLSGDTAGMTSDQFAWCSRFVKQAAIKSGVDPKSISGANDMARSWLNVGQDVKTPAQGDIAVLPRGNPNGPYGHVGFYAGEGKSPGSIKLLAGNQGDAVTYREYPAASVLGYRRLGPEGAFAAETIPNIHASGYGRESGPGYTAPDQSYTSTASTEPSPTGEASPSQSWLGKTLGLSPSVDKGLGGIAAAAGAFAKPQDASGQQLAALRDAAIKESNAALSEDEQRQQVALKSVLGRRQRSAFA